MISAAPETGTTQTSRFRSRKYRLVSLGNAVATRAPDAMSTTLWTSLSSVAATLNRFGHEIPAGHAQISRAVRDEFGYVGGADEDRLEQSAERRGQRAISVNADIESGIGE